MFDWNRGVVILENGNLARSFTNEVVFHGGDDLSGSHRLKVKIFASGAKAGLFDGTAIDPVSQNVIPIRGAIFQQHGTAYGWFTGTNQTGSVFIGPR